MNLPPNHFSFEANCYDSLRRGFGDRGYDLTKAFSDRKTRHRHNNGLEEEIWILRRYLFTLASENILNYPLSLQNHESPDFIGTYQGLLGTFGGRYRHGASGGPNTRSHTPERDLTADVLAALIRKRKKIKKHYKPTTKIDVVIYANSNAQRLTYETDYVKILQRKIAQWHQYIFFNKAVRNIAILKEETLILFDRCKDAKILNLRATI